MSRPITSLTGFVRKVDQLTQKYHNAQILYRGHADRQHKMTPSVLRSENLRKSEHLLIRNLISRHPGEFSGDINTFDRLVRAQHYGLPTRILDMTLNPLVALFFACKDRPSAVGQVIAVVPNMDRQKYFDSDTVSCLCNLAYLKAGEKKEIYDEVGRIASEELYENKGYIDEFCRIKSVDKLIQFIRNEKPHFVARIVPIDLAVVVSVIPRWNHARIVAQHGAFLCFGLISEYDGKDLSDSTSTEAIDIDNKQKHKILAELARVGITNDSMFPEIENTAGELKRAYS